MHHSELFNNYETITIDRGINMVNYYQIRML